MFSRYTIPPKEVFPHVHFFLVSENKVLCHPSSVDSLSTSAATEDHVSMGGWAARKALRVVEHVEQGKKKKSILVLLEYI